MLPAAWKLWVLEITFCKAIAPALSPAETMVSPATVEAVMAGLANPTRAGLLLTAAVRLKPLACCALLLSPSPNSWLKLTPVAPRCVESLVTLSE